MLMPQGNSVKITQHIDNFEDRFTLSEKLKTKLRVTLLELEQNSPGAMRFTRLVDSCVNTKTCTAGMQERRTFSE